MLNTPKIKGRLAELELTQKDVAVALGVARATASQKINNVRALSLDEAEQLAKLLEIGSDDFGTYFFAQ